MFKRTLLALALGLAAVAPAHAKPAKADALTRMFTWWNAAFKTPGAYTPAAFRAYFTEDATLTINGAQVATGVEGWAKHFQRIQGNGGIVEIVLPFRKVGQVGDTIYTYHVIRSVRSSVAGCLLAGGYATVRGGKISAVVLSRAPIDASSDPDCAMP